MEYADSDGNPLPDEAHPVNRVLAKGEAVTAELKVRAEGGWKEVEVQSIPLVDATGSLRGIAEIFRDLGRTGHRPQEYRDLKMAASRDPLTKVANRGELETQLALRLTKAAEQTPPQPFSVIFADIDFFKSINDNYGHQIGDEVLVNTARLLQQECYSGELVARYGGEEFVILCPDTDLEAGERRAERLRRAIQAAQLSETVEVRVTASFGVATMEAGDSVESLCRRSDKALYEAKESGRNRTCKLTTGDLLGDRWRPTKAPPSDPFLLTGLFHAHLQADMLVYKLGGFLEEAAATLKQIDGEGAVIRIGGSRLFGGWGRTSASQPVELRLELKTIPARPQDRAASSTTEVNYTIKPLGRTAKPDVFQKRAREVLKLLRAFFAIAD
jgi:diguanylate cyclase (GGDEF)-like protein